MYQKYERKGKVTMAYKEEWPKIENITLIDVMSKYSECETVWPCFRARGKAVLRDGEKFDEAKGKAIAGARADLKINRKLQKRMHMAIKELAQALEEARNLEQKHRARAECIEQTLDRLTR